MLLAGALFHRRAVARGQTACATSNRNEIEKDHYPKWRVCAQVMPEKDAETYTIHPFDLTKVWPHKDYPLIEVGIMELNRNPENHFAEVEAA